MDPGRRLFERLKDEGWTLIEEFLRTEEPETIHLEFKCKADPKSPKLGDGDKRSLAKALSGLANTEGGVIVLGVQAHEIAGGLDRARGVVEIADVEACAGELVRRLAFLTDPLIAGLRIEPIRHGSTGAGVVVVCVPPSDGGPHRATGASSEVNDRYYMRSLAGTSPMPHSLLVDRFARNAPPRLSLWLRYQRVSHVRQIELRLFNFGRGVARRPAVLIHTPAGSKVEYDTGQLYAQGFLLRYMHSTEGLERVIIEPHQDIAMYPGTDRVLTQAGIVADGDLRFRAVCHALYSQPREGEGILPAHALGTEPGPAIFIPPAEFHE